MEGGREGGKEGEVQINVTVFNYRARNRCEDAEEHAEEENGFGVEALENSRHEKGGDEADGAHGEEAEGGGEGGEVVYLLGYEDGVIDCGLVAAVGH